MKNERPSGQELNNSCSVVSVRGPDNLEDICSMLEFTELMFIVTRKHYLSAARGLKGENHEIFTGIKNDETGNPDEAPVMGRVLVLG